MKFKLLALVTNGFLLGQYILLSMDTGNVRYVVVSVIWCIIAYMNYRSALNAYNGK